MRPDKLEQIATQINELSESLVKEKDATQLPTNRIKHVRTKISDACLKLQKIVEDLDPIKHPQFVFDPSDPNVAGRIAGITMIAQKRNPLINLDRFYGAGVYAIYYVGKFPAYAAISRREHPIYVGKADPADPASKTVMEQGYRLSNRLNEHRNNLKKASTTLRLEDFEYRALVVQTGWQAAAEDYLIHLFKPIWNNEVGICFGFGKHGDDPATRSNLRSPWDTLHPGRDWAHRDPNMKDARPPKQIMDDIARHLTKHPPFGTMEEILSRFIDEMRGVS